MTTRPTLPQNFRISTTKPLLTVPCSEISNWSATHDSTVLSLDTVNFRSTAAIKVTATQYSQNGNGVRYHYPLTCGSINHCRNIGMWIYIYGNPTSIPAISATVNAAANINSYATLSFNISSLTSGWNYIYTDFSRVGYVSGGFTWDMPIGYVTVYIPSSETNLPVVSIGELEVGIPFLSTFCVTLDDGLSGVYDNAYPILAAAGIPATAYICSNAVGNAGYMSLSELQELHSAGWTIGNHTTNHSVLTTLSSEEIVETVVGCAEYLQGNGMYRGAYHLAYPAGAYDSAVMTTLRSIPVLTARTIDGVAATALPTQGMTIDMMQIDPIAPIYDGKSVASLRYLVDSCVLSGMNMITYSHTVGQDVGVPSMQCTTEHFQEMIDYLVTLKPYVRFCTIDEWYNGLTNPRYRSLPVTRATV